MLKSSLTEYPIALTTDWRSGIKIHQEGGLVQDVFGGRPVIVGEWRKTIGE